MATRQRGDARAHYPRYGVYHSRGVPRSDRSKGRKAKGGEDGHSGRHGVSRQVHRKAARAVRAEVL